ncbi:hypothetical protein Agabi119p4_712 [Agaricus bisporus var. burnettii]|uniref:Small-subunit processome Utp12 domain-containing protein n=1 Tax=Agaricus bisporus var. burnettii TaxID=192524 RepID=A0A8H7FB63_AGABI|nr:hypothetical protein Agabi119p4_712 [Agaricus bisporus var. burnettii]
MPDPRPWHKYPSRPSKIYPLKPHPHPFHPAVIILRQAIADHVVDIARISSMTWCALDTTAANSSGTPQPSKKKKRKRDSALISDVKNKATEIVVLGLSDGRILCFSPSHGRVLYSLSHASSASAILATAVEEYEDQWLVWASGADSTLRMWDMKTNNIIANWKNDDRIPYTSLKIRPCDVDGRTDILAASHSIYLLSKSASAGTTDPKKLHKAATFTGHASPVKSTTWDLSKPVPARFFSMAESDRFVYVWDILDSPDVSGKAVASIPLDAAARSFAVATSAEPTGPSTLLALSASGKITLYHVPDQIITASTSNRSSSTLPTLHFRSSIIATSESAQSPSDIIDVSFVHGRPGSICVARLVRGIRPVFTTVRYLDDAGRFIENIQLEDVPDVSLEDKQPLIHHQRYSESSVAVGSSMELGYDENPDETTSRNMDGELDVNLAELSLGQRLATVTDADYHQPSDSESEDVTHSRSSRVTNKKEKSELDVIPANSLTRTLIQALHSSDTKLIETCLAHSNSDLIRNTVKRLPSQLAIPLLNACVERLGRGARAANMKGGGAAASAQRGMTLIIWIRTVLTFHMGHLMTVPDLVARLSGLHATLTARLALQESLLSLSGRLDVVLSQIEMRSSLPPTIVATTNGKRQGATRENFVKQYVEGESDSSGDDNDQMDVELEIGDDEGSIEDVELGGSSEGSEDDQDEDGEEKEEEDDGSGSDGFIDDEAEEYSEDDEDESE